MAARPEQHERPWNTSLLQALAIEILQARGVGLAVSEAAGRLIAVDAQLNIWMLQTGKPTKTDAELWHVLEEHEACLEEARAAWSAFLKHDLPRKIQEHNAKPVDEKQKASTR